WQAGRKDEALAVYEQTVEAYKPDLGSFPRWVGMSIQNRAKLAGGTGQGQEAIELYQLLARLSKDGQVQRELGDALQGQGRLDEAISSYSEAIRLDKGDFMAHHNLGLAFERKGQMDEAIGSFREAVRLRNHDPTPHFHLGGVLLEKGQLDEAIAS